MGGVSMEWKEVRLGDVCSKIGSGATPSGGKEAYKGGDYHLIRSQNVLDFAFSKDGLASINDEQANKLKNVEIIQGDVLLNITGDSVARCCIVPSEILPARVNQHVAIIRPRKEELDNHYLLYYLQYYKRQLLQIASAGATRNAITKAMIENLILPCPKSLDDQRRIASILSSLDRKIELNNKINADLEEMAQAIFKNWFVDFEPFKDGKFVDSELGMIPEGWKVVVFDNILKVTTTKTGKEGIPEYSVTNTGIHPRDEKFTKNLSKSSAKNKLIRKGNLVFGMSREILNWGIMKEEVGGVSSAYNVYIVDEKIVSTTYLECFIAQRMDYFADLIKPASREGQGVDKALLMKKIICIPPSEVLDVFLEKYNSIMHLTEIRNQENSRLSLLRDTLLPRLMSGELEVPE